MVQSILVFSTALLFVPEHKLEQTQIKSDLECTAESDIRQKHHERNI